MSTAIAVQNLYKTFHTKNRTVQAVQNVSFEIPIGTTCGFLGPNGAGKTTTIKMICNLILPSSGKIFIHGINAGTHRSQAIQKIGAVLEGNRNIYWELTAKQNLYAFGYLRGISGSWLQKQVSTLLNLLDLSHVQNEHVGTFSRGMQQKVAIACALVADPPILLLDEPLLGLDIYSAQTIKNAITYLTAQRKKTFLITTHQINIAEELCNHIIIINKGTLVANASKVKLFEQFTHTSLTDIFVQLTKESHVHV